MRAIQQDEEMEAFQIMLKTMVSTSLSTWLMIKKRRRKKKKKKMMMSMRKRKRKGRVRLGRIIFPKESLYLLDPKERLTVTLKYRSAAPLLTLVLLRPM